MIQIVIQSTEEDILHSLFLYTRSTFFTQPEKRLYTTTLEVFMFEKDVPKLMKELYQRGHGEEIIFYRRWFSLEQLPVLVDYFIQGSFNEGYFDYFGGTGWFVKNADIFTVCYKPQYVELVTQHHVFWAPKIN